MPAKQRIQADSPGEHPYDHLLPVVKAEKSWGNSVTMPGWERDPKLGGWTLTMFRPLDVARLREMFDFPDTIILSDSMVPERNGIEVRCTTLWDSGNDIAIVYRDWRGDWPASVVRFYDRVRGWLSGTSGAGRESSGSGGAG